MKQFGQSAAEFLMTYGWALILIMVVSVVAYQLGLFSIAGDVEPGATGFWGMVPTDFRFSAGSGDLDVSVTNNLGAGVTVSRFSYVIHSGSKEYARAQFDLNAGESNILEFMNIGGGDTGGRFDVQLEIIYVDTRTGKTHSSSGKIWGAYEE